MLVKLASVAVLVGLMSSGAAPAQTAAQIGGPRELPPASFQGQQYVDSRGCVFLRAGYGGAVNWVPRVDARRQVICGQQPSFGPRAPIQVAEEAPVVAPPAPRVTVTTSVTPPAPQAPAPTRRVAAPLASPLPTPAPTVTVAAQPAPYAATPPAPQVRVATVAAGPGPGKIGCYASAPVAEVVQLTNGGRAVVCTRGDGGLSGWRPPIYPAGRGPGAALTYPTRDASSPAAVAPGTRGVTYAAAQPTAQPAVPTPPPGYRLAWTDDRLNPMRGVGTVQGQAAQDRVWTREVPAQQVVVAAPQVQPQAQIRTSTKTQPTAPVVEAQPASGPSYVQVGSFGVPSNADGAAARLKALGLPVAKSQMTSGGKALQVVYAGPFASAAAAANALSMARGAGFSDAFIR